MKSIRKSLALAAADSYLTLALQLVSTVVISRILTPHEAGIFAVASVFTSLAGAFRNFGIAEYLIQEKQLDDDTIRGALSVNIIVSWGMALLLFIAAPLIADFFRTPEVIPVVRLLSLNFLLIPFGAITMAYFRRELNMQPMLVASVLSNSASFAVSITLALAGYGVMALAWAGFAGVAVTVAVSIWFRPASFPRWPGTRGIGRAFHFGKYASGIYLFGQAGSSAPDIVIGRALDVVSVAFYSRANGLVELFDRLVISAVWPVCLPYLAKAEREQDSVKEAYLISVSFLTAVSWPMLAYLGIASFSVIRIVYGAQWLGSVGLAEVLCAAAFVTVTYQLAKESLLAKGLVKQSNHLQMVLQGSRVVGLFAVIPFGLLGACWGLFFAAIVGATYAHQQLHRSIGLSLRDMLAACRTSFWLALIPNLPILMWAWLDPVGENNYVRFGVGGGLLTVATWIACLRIFRHRLWAEGVNLGSSLRQRILGA